MKLFSSTFGAVYCHTGSTFRRRLTSELFRSRGSLSARKLLSCSWTKPCSLQILHCNSRTGDFKTNPAVYENPEECTERLLEWDELCVHVGRFANTLLGKHRCRKLRIAKTYSEAMDLQEETKAVEVFASKLKVEFIFGNVSTELMETSLDRCLKGGTLSGLQLMSISALISTAKRLQKAILSPFKKSGLYKDLRETAGILYEPWKEVQVPLELKALIDFAVDEEGNLKDSASEELKASRMNYQTIKKRLETLLKTSFDGQVVERSGRICLAVTSNNEVPSNALILDAGSRGMVYCEPRSALSLNNDLAAALGEMKTTEEAILDELTTQVTQQAEHCQKLLKMVIQLDIALARLRYTYWIDGSFPNFSIGEEEHEIPREEKDFFLSLMNLRHPLLMGQSLIYSEANSRRFHKDDFQLSAPIPNDVILTSQTKALVITGPNAGGKTATLKALGLCALMAKAGLGLPAKQPVWIPYYSSVLADIGDEQSLTSSLSTFSGHLKRIQNLRTISDGKCLVLLDELGTGTDPKEGAALGAALLKALVKGGSGGALTTVISTHHALLTTLAYDQDSETNGVSYSVFENASMEFDDEALAPTYRLIMGVPGQSNALNIASRLGMDLRIIGDAKSRLGRRHASENILISQIQDEQEILEDISEEIERLEKKLKKVEEKMVKMEAKTNSLEYQLMTQEADIYFKAHDHGVASLKLMKSQKEKLELREKHKSSSTEANTSPLTSKETKSEAKHETVSKVKKDWSPKVGEIVYVKDLGKEGKVIEVKGNKEAMVRVGLLTITVARSSLEQV